MTKTHYGWKLWEVILLVITALTLLAGGWAQRTQENLANQVVRLHVLANSDSPEDQALKLAVRDAVLAQAAGYLEDCPDRTSALKRLEANLEPLAQAGAEVVAAQGYEYPVTVRLEQWDFPTKYYDGFALPAGEYTALRVLIGQGDGQNWWCVLFPQLCLAPAADWEDTALEGGVSSENVALMDTEDVQLKFKAVELWEQLTGQAG